MTVRIRRSRSGEPRLFIDIRYRTADGRKLRFRQDAQVQTKSAARAEDQRLLAELGRRGTLERAPKRCSSPAPPRYTFEDGVRQFRATRLATLKPSTQLTYNERLNKLLVPRFGATPLDELGGDALGQLDAELAREKLKPSTRRNLQIVFRSVLRCSVDAGLLAAMPILPRLPRVGRQIMTPMHEDDLHAVLTSASEQARVAFLLAAYAGLRASEVRGLRWSDVDLKGGVLTVRRAITRGEETTPKSGHHRVVPLAAPLRAALEAAGVRRNSPWAPVAVTAHGKVWGEHGLNQAFERAQRRAGREGWSFHSLRHYFVTELFRRGASAPAVQRLAGHADLATTQRYADMVAEDLRAAITLLGGNSGAMVPRDTNP